MLGQNKAEIWKVMKTFLDEETIEKINIFDEKVPEPIFQYAHQSQLERRFGGSMEDIKEGDYWPPRERSKQYQLDKGPRTQLATR